MQIRFTFTPISPNWRACLYNPCGSVLVWVQRAHILYSISIFTTVCPTHTDETKAHTQPKIRPKLKKQSHPHSYHLNRKSSFQRHLIRNLKFKRLERLLNSQPFSSFVKKKKNSQPSNHVGPIHSASRSTSTSSWPFFLDSRKLASHIYSLSLTTTCQRRVNQNKISLHSRRVWLWIKKIWVWGLVGLVLWVSRPKDIITTEDGFKVL